MTTDWIKPGVAARLDGCGVGIAGRPVVKIVYVKQSAGWASVRIGAEGSHYPPATMNVRLHQLSRLAA